MSHIQQSIHLIQTIANQKEIVVAYSGGKDSEVMIKLCQLAGVEFIKVHKVTTVDSGITMKHISTHHPDCIKLKPKMSFLDMCEKYGLQTSYNGRKCCSIFKEYVADIEIGKAVLIGVRLEESNSRAGRYKEPTECFGKGRKKCEHVYPILQWSDDDVWSFIKEYRLPINPLYQTQKRVGCLGVCGFASKEERSTFFYNHNDFLFNLEKRLHIFAKSKSKIQLKKLSPKEQIYALQSRKSIGKIIIERTNLFGLPTPAELFYESLIKTKNYENPLFTS